MAHHDFFNTWLVTNFKITAGSKLRLSFCIFSSFWRHKVRHIHVHWMLCIKILECFLSMRPQELKDDPFWGCIFFFFPLWQVTGERYCRAQQEALHASHTYLCLLASTRSHQALHNLYHAKGECSTEEAAGLVGLRLPTQPGGKGWEKWKHNRSCNGERNFKSHQTFGLQLKDLTQKVQKTKVLYIQTEISNKSRRIFLHDGPR